MTASNRIWRLAVVASCLAALGSGGVLAAPGDIHRVTNADVVNLRAGPSDQTKVRGRVNQGEEVIELTRRGDWVGVRVLDTGEEGWIYGELLDPVSRSTLGAEGVATGDAGFLRLSESFDQLVRRINDDLGYPIVQEARQLENSVLRVAPTSEWLINGSRDAHVMTAAAIYQMWKNHQNGGPVGVVMLDDRDQEYITIQDRDTGPELSVAVPQR